jgi:hypothetical protein
VEKPITPVRLILVRSSQLLPPEREKAGFLMASPPAAVVVVLPPIVRHPPRASWRARVEAWCWARCDAAYSRGGLVGLLLTVPLWGPIFTWYQVTWLWREGYRTVLLTILLIGAGIAVLWWR